MHKFNNLLFVLILMTVAGCTQQPNSDAGAARSDSLDSFWRNAIVYFILTDKFNNGDPTNDNEVGRVRDGAVLRDFSGGDIKGITQKIRTGYFTALGVDVIWTTPLIENIHGAIEELNFGRTYAAHGYWPKDWTAVDPNFGTENELREMIDAAHEKGIRVLADVVLNHTGPVTEIDEAWPSDWVRPGPRCEWHDFAATVTCEIVEALPDIYTERNEDVELPHFLLEKWRREGREKQELAELDTFFARTGYPRAPRYYIIKWLTDWVRDYGIDGFRVDTVRHVEAEVWQDLRTQAKISLTEWKEKNPKKKIDDREFYMIGEVFEYGLAGFGRAVVGGRAYDYGDIQVDYFDFGFNSLINIGFPQHANWPLERLFSTYSNELNTGPFKGVGMMNYIASHDDQKPYDQDRTKTFEAATKLMLAPGAVQIYYGDEVARDLTIEGTTDDATLRSEMDWAALKAAKNQTLLEHWRKLGKFRQAHVSVGAGVHQKLQDTPYVFSRLLDEKYISDRVLVGIDLPKGSLSVFDTFSEGAVLKDYYSGRDYRVKEGSITLMSPQALVLLGMPRVQRQKMH